MAIVVLGTDNVYTASFNVTTGVGTLAISGVVGFDLTDSSLNSVYSTTHSVALNCERVTVSYVYTAGLPVWTFTFFSIPAGVVSGDSLVISLNIPDEFLNYSALQKIAV